jgi:hypothetical protein
MLEIPEPKREVQLDKKDFQSRRKTLFEDPVSHQGVFPTVEAVMSILGMAL